MQLMAGLIQMHMLSPDPPCHAPSTHPRSPFYVAPEVITEGRATKASDIYSLGVLLWEVYNATPPWIKGADGAYKPNPRFPSFPQGAPQRYVSLAKRCMTRDWKVRPNLTDVAGDMRSMHEAWLDGYDSLEQPTAEGGADHAHLGQAGRGKSTGLEETSAAAKALSAFVGAKTPTRANQSRMAGSGPQKASNGEVAPNGAGGA